MYVVRSSDEVDEQIAHLPHEGAARFAELRAALELDPWSGDPYVRTKPDSAMRTRERSSVSVVWRSQIVQAPSSSRT